ncbi:MAG: hypothetical protein FK732_07140 [Asgard group archaeon]|nr:hypothetical protein [Asgard group archaeon]
MKMSKKKQKEEASLQYLQGKKAYEARNAEQAYIALEKALHYFRNTSEYVILADIHRILAEIFFEKGNMIESRNHYKRAYQAFNNYGHKIGMADCYDNIAISFMLQDELKHAKDYQTNALKLRKGTPDKKGRARGLKNLAIIIYKKEEDGEKAIKLLNEAIELAQKSKEPQLVINIALDQSKILNKLGKFEEAMKAYIIARRFSKKHSIPLSEEREEEFGDLLLNLGLKRYDDGDLEEALKYLKNAALILKSKNNPLVEDVEQTIQKIEQHIK